MRQDAMQKKIHAAISPWFAASWRADWANILRKLTMATMRLPRLMDPKLYVKDRLSAPRVTPVGYEREL